MLLDQIHGRYKGKVIPPSKGHGSNDKKVKETNISYETQGKSVLNYLCRSFNVPLQFSIVRKSTEKVTEFPPSGQEDSFFEKVVLGDEALEVSKAQHRAQGELRWKFRSISRCVKKSALSNCSGTRVANR